MHRLSRGISFLVVISLVLTACGGRSDQFQYSGTVQSESAQVGSTIGGRVSAVYVSDGQRVRRHQVLVQLQASDEMAALAAARSQQAQAAAALADLEAGPRPAEVARAAGTEAQALAALQKAQTAQADLIAAAAANVRQARAGLRQAQAAATQAAQSDRRISRLFRQGAVAAQAADDARSADRQARAQVVAARARVAAARAQLAQTARSSTPQDINAAQGGYQAAAANRELVQQGARAQQIAQARAAVGAAQANVAAAEARLNEMRVISPADGIIEELDIRSGDLVAPGAQVASVHEFLDPYVRVYVTQHDLGRLTVGQHVRVRSDALSGAEFDGRVEQIDQHAQFTPRDVQTAEDRADLTFGAKVRIHDPGRALLGGTTVEVALP